jgi:hypothetical protein
MGVLQRLTDCGNDCQCLLWLQFSIAQHVAKVHSVDELHHQEIQSSGLAEVVDGDDMRMVELRKQLRLTCEAPGEAGIVFPLRSEDLDGDQAVERFLPRLVNDPHAAPTEAFDDLELREFPGDFPRLQRWNRRGAFPIQCPRREGLRHQTSGAELVLTVHRHHISAIGASLGFVHLMLSLRVGGNSLRKNYSESAANRARISSSMSRSSVNVRPTSSRNRWR